MIEVFDTQAARRALAARALACPDCCQPLALWGHARHRTVADLGGGQLDARPGRARCTGCRRTHVVLAARLLPCRAYTAEVIGQALAGAAAGLGHRPVAAVLGVPAATARGWIRAARRGADLLRQAGVQALVALEPDALPWPGLPGPLAGALEVLAAAAAAMARRFGLEHTPVWARINVLTRGRLLTLARAG